jgi:hypothetical protein
MYHSSFIGGAHARDRRSSSGAAMNGKAFLRAAAEQIKRR